MNFNLQQASFQQVLGKESIATPIDEYRDWAPVIILVIAYLSFLILNPFIAIFVLSILSLFVRGYSKSMLLMFAFAFSIFYASRDIYLWFGDDVPVYLFTYHINLNKSLGGLFYNFFSFRPADNEILYFLYMWIIGKLINPGPEAYIFIVYFGQLILLSVAAYLVSKRYAFIFLIVFFFGLGDPNPEILHLWRASYATLIFLIGVILYFKGNPKSGRIIIFASAGFHVSLLLLIIIFEIYRLLARRDSFILTIVLGVLFFSLAMWFFKTVFMTLFPLKAGYFFKDVVATRNLTKEFVVIVLLGANYYYKFSSLARFGIFLLLCSIFFEWIFADTSRYMSRMAQLVNPVVTVTLFEVVIRQKKRIISLSIIGLLFLKVILKPSFEMYHVMIPEHRNPLYGVANNLLNW